MGRKKKHICHASVLKKDEFENLILEIIIKVFGTESRINYLADCVMAVYNDKLKEHSAVDLLKRDRDEVQKALDNIMRAIEQGIITETTQRRMKELEERKQTLNDKIVIAQYGESQRLTKQEIVEYLTHSLRQEPRFLLHILVKSIIVYDDKIEIYFNFTERKNPDDSDDTDSRDNNYANCSDILPMCPPRKKTGFRLSFCVVEFKRRVRGTVGIQISKRLKVPSFAFAIANLDEGSRKRETSKCRM